MINTIKQFDYIILSLFHNLAINYGHILNPIAKSFHYIGSPLTCVPAIISIILFLLTKRKRWIVIFVAICLSAICSQLLIKKFIFRPRPYTSETIKEYYDWWISSGSLVESGYSFPSGHATSSMGFASSFYFTSKRKKISWIVFVYAFIMSCSRCYLMVHYPSDVITGMIVGFVIGFLAYKVSRR